MAQKRLGPITLLKFTHIKSHSIDHFNGLDLTKVEIWATFVESIKIGGT